jgi:hypothetical protein
MHNYRERETEWRRKEKFYEKDNFVSLCLRLLWLPIWTFASLYCFFFFV